jgi:hypothetical protein
VLGIAMPNALETFRHAFAGWVRAHSLVMGIPFDSEVLLTSLANRIGNDTLRLIGTALLNGWLETEKGDNRGYFVRETDRPGTAGGQFTIERTSDSKVKPCWELYVQLADYALLRTEAQRRGLKVRLEDHLMDITVWAGETLVLYVENKETRSQAHSLLKKMNGYGETGFRMDDFDKGNDGLRKAKYLFSRGSPPEYFALSAVGYRQLFSIEYLGNENRFKLIESPNPIIAPLHEAHAIGDTPAWSAVDGFALELQRYMTGLVWISPGSGQTAFNVYLPAEQQDNIVLGIYKTGEVWTDFKALGNNLSERLAERLRTKAIILDTSKEWAYWVKDEGRFDLRQSDVATIAMAIAEAILPT